MSSSKPAAEFLVIVAGRKRKDPRVVHHDITAAVLEAHRMRELPANLDRTVHIVSIEVTLPPVVPGRDLRGIRE